MRNSSARATSNKGARVCASPLHHALATRLLLIKFETLVTLYNKLSWFPDSPPHFNDGRQIKLLPQSEFLLQVNGLTVFSM